MGKIMENDKTSIQQTVQNVIDYNKKLDIAQTMIPKLTGKEKQQLKKNIESLKSEVFPETMEQPEAQ